MDVLTHGAVLEPQAGREIELRTGLGAGVEEREVGRLACLTARQRGKPAATSHTCTAVTVKPRRRLYVVTEAKLNVYL